jgi:class 3 adenylate cyclase
MPEWCERRRDRARLTCVRQAEVRYAERDGDYLAYSVFGDGPNDLAIAQGRFPIDLMWELPQLAAFMDALGRLARVIVWDSRGVGASDPLRDLSAANAEVFADDLSTVLDAAACDRVSIFGLGSPPSLIFAATYPERVRSLIAVNFRLSYPDLRRFSTSQLKRLAMTLRSPDRLRFENPRSAHDPVLQQWWGHAMRLANSPEGMARNLESAQNADVEVLAPTLQTPTLVLHRRDNRVWDVDTSRVAASKLPNARFVELPGAENDIFLGDTAPVLTEIERFLTESETEVATDRVLSTVLFTDMVASTEQLAARGDDAWRRVLDNHDATTAHLVAHHRGTVVKQLGDGILAMFDGPARAVRCAAALLDAAQRQGITLRAGLHTGEIEVRPADVTGIAVHVASRIANLANANEILVSRTVVDLTAGSGLRFELRGEHQLKGVPGTWPIFATSALS